MLDTVERKNAYKILVGMHEEKRLSLKPRRRLTFYENFGFHERKYY